LAAPVRIVSHGDQAKLASVLEELLEETTPIVPAPDYNNARFVNDLRLEPLGLKKWRDSSKTVVALMSSFTGKSWCWKNGPAMQVLSARTHYGSNASQRVTFQG